MRLLTLHCLVLNLITVFYMGSIIHPYLSLLFSHFVFLFSPFSYSSRHETYTIYNAWFDFITPACNITKIKILHSPRQKKKGRVNYNQNKYSNIFVVQSSFSSLLTNLKEKKKKYISQNKTNIYTAYIIY